MLKEIFGFVSDFLDDILSSSVLLCFQKTIVLFILNLITSTYLILMLKIVKKIFSLVIQISKREENQSKLNDIDEKMLLTESFSRPCM